MVKQYVGARYVPKFASPVEWASDTSYEALTIVTFNNASYTSKIPVPPTVGNPANNPKYWALTGNYNAQVEEYRQETIKVKTALYYVTPEEYGANGDGTTDDTKALQNAINSGKVVKLTTGKKYHISSPLELKDSLIISGNGSIDTSSDYIINQTSAVGNVFFDGITFNGNIEICCYYSTFTNCTFNGNVHLINGNATGTLVENRLINNTFRNGNITTQEGAKLTDGFFINNIVNENEVMAIGQGSGWIIDGNHFYGNSQALHVGHAYNTRITNNYIENSSENIISAQVQMGTIISGNIFFGTGNINIYKDGFFPYANDKTIITNNSGNNCSIKSEVNISTDFSLKIDANSVTKCFSTFFKSNSNGLPTLNDLYLSIHSNREMIPGDNTVSIILPTNVNAYSKVIVNITVAYSKYTTQSTPVIEDCALYFAQGENESQRVFGYKNGQTVTISNGSVNENNLTFTIRIPDTMFGLANININKLDA